MEEGGAGEGADGDQAEDGLGEVRDHRRASDGLEALQLPCGGGEVGFGHLVDEEDGEEGEGKPGQEDADEDTSSKHPDADGQVVLEHARELRVDPVRVGGEAVDDAAGGGCIEEGHAASQH
eukprot:757381-Hanusia_phi.AAC.8